MFSPGQAGVVAFGMLLSAATPSVAVESIGKAVHIKTEVTGASRELAVNDPVYRDERIRTSKSGLGQFVFRDGTKLAVGWGSSVVIDKFVFDGSGSVKKLTIKAAKGTFRWISGNSKKTAYEIVTPAGTIGVRGTVFDFYVGADGTTAVVLLGGSANFCGADGCRQLARRCDYVVAKRNGSLTNTRRVDPAIFKTLGNTKALPFLSGNQKLTAGGGGSGCGLAKVVDIKPDKVTAPEPKKAKATPNKPDKEKPEKPEKPDKEKPEKPEKPDKEKPEKPEKPDKEKPDKEKPDKEKPDKEKPDKEKPDKEKPDKERPDKDKPRDDRDKPDGDKSGGKAGRVVSTEG